MRLIDADVLMKWFEPFKEIKTAGIPQILEAINAQPTVEAAPVVHSKWCDSYKSGYKPPRGSVCAECDCWNERTTTYCPNCAAKMDL